METNENLNNEKNVKTRVQPLDFYIIVEDVGNETQKYHAFDKHILFSLWLCRRTNST